MNGAKRRKVAQDVPRKTKPIAQEKPARAEPKSSSDEESEEESATLEEPSAEETAVDAPKKTFKDLVWLTDSLFKSKSLIIPRESTMLYAKPARSSTTSTPRPFKNSPSPSPFRVEISSVSPKQVVERRQHLPCLFSKPFSISLSLCSASSSPQLVNWQPRLDKPLRLSVRLSRYDAL